jgi:hypothetical protein
MRFLCRTREGLARTGEATQTHSFSSFSKKLCHLEDRDHIKRINKDGETFRRTRGAMPELAKTTCKVASL